MFQVMFALACVHGRKEVLVRNNVGSADGQKQGWTAGRCMFMTDEREVLKKVITVRHYW